MASHVSINMETIAEEKNKTTPGPLSFRSSAIVAVALKKRPNNLRSLKLKRKQLSKLLSLEQCLCKDSTPIQTLVAQGKLEELKNVIKEHKLTLEEVDENGYTLLHLATIHNQEHIMLFLIQSGINLNSVDNSGNTPLHLAAENNLPEACHLLLVNRANDRILNNDEYAPLHLAAMGKNKALEVMLDHPIDTIVTGYRGKNTLHFICEQDNIQGMVIIQKKVISKLMKTEAKGSSFKICAPDDTGLTPLHLAARKNSYRVLDFIINICIEYGFDTTKILGFFDEENSTPLHAAIDSCNFEVAEVLLKHGASPIDSKGTLIPPLHLACSQGRSDMIKMMVEHAGPEIISFADQHQKTPLHYCASSIHSSCMIPYLVERGKKFIEIDARDCRGRTPLHNAVTSANLAATKELISYGANPLVKDVKGLNTLHLAVNSNRKPIVNSLLELTCAAELIIETCSRGYSAIHHALHVGLSDMVPKMISTLHVGVQNIQDEEGNNYLHVAARKGDAKALKTLLNVPEVHKLLNEPNKLGMTPLHAAASGGHYRCIDLLLNNGAMYHKALNGETAFMIACKNGFTSCSKLLLKSHPCQIGSIDENGDTALHAAAISRTPSLITLLLDKECKLSVNSQSLSFLDMLIDCGDLDCVLAVINHERWQECLDFFSSSHSSPILKLIEQMPKAAKAVLDRCHSKANFDKSHSDYYESFDFKYLYYQTTEEKSIKDIVGFTVNDIVSFNVESPYSNTEPYTTVMYKEQNQKSTNSSQGYVKTIEYGRNTMKVVQKMKEFKRQNLLTHPVVNAFLNSKWQKYGNIYYFVIYLFHILMVVLLSLYVIIIPHPLMELSTQATHNQSCTNNTDNNTEVLVLNVIRGVNLSLNAIYMIWIVFEVVILIKRRNGISSFFQVTVWIDVSSVIFMYIFFAFPKPVDLWPFGAVACFLSWLSLLLLLEQLSLPGTIVRMFLEVTKTVVLVLFVSVFLLLAFAFSLYILAGSLSEFVDVGYAFLSVFGFMLGELPYDTYIQLEVAGSLTYGKPILALIFFLSILLSIVLVNLLIGLAVGDIERVKLNAILQRKEIEIEFFAQLDASIPRGTLKRCSLRLYTVHPNKNRSFWSIWRDSWKWIENKIEPEQSDSASFANASLCLTEISELKMHVLEIKETIQQLQETNTEFKKRYSSLSAHSSASSLDFDHELNL